jgi:hypothetical protein
MQILVSLALFCWATAFGVIYEAPNLEKLEQEMGHLDSQALVLFDVDKTLIMPKDAILMPCNKPLLMEFIQEISNTSSCAYSANYLKSRVLSQAVSTLVDPKSLSLIKTLQQKGIKTIALTAAGTGPFGTIPELMDWRIQELNHLGVNFTPAFPHHSAVLFKEFRGKHSFPGFKEGILFSSQFPKGEVLKAFLAYINWRPTKIVFIDDKMSFIQSVEQAAQELGIEFIGFHYTAVSHLACYTDEKLAKFQFRHLAQKGQWLSDREAKHVLTQTQERKEALESVR